MFVNSVQVISSRLEHLTIIVPEMQPKAERPPMCPKVQLPLFQVTPSNEHQKKGSASNQQHSESPWLLRPHHSIPSTPPPQAEPKPFDYFPQRIG